MFSQAQLRDYRFLMTESFNKHDKPMTFIQCQRYKQLMIQVICHQSKVRTFIMYKGSLAFLLITACSAIATSSRTKRNNQGEL